MQYKEYHPNVLLSPYIKTYWVSDDLRGEGDCYKVLPDGCVEIIFMFDTTKETVYAGIVGTKTSFFEVGYPQTLQVFGIRFKPAGITTFTRIPVDEFTDRNVELALVETLFNQSFCELLSEKKSMAEIIAQTDSFLISRLPFLYSTDRKIFQAVDLISHAKGIINLASVASEVCLCQRHFERKFKSIIGISPKMFAKILRFNHTVQYLQNNPHKDLLTIAVECGYHDKSHLFKDFKMLSGNTPTNYRL